MHFQLKLLRRTLFARRRGLTRFTAAVAVIGITAGVASLIVALAVSKGFQNELRNRLLADTPHISIFREDRGEIENAAAIAAILSEFEDIVSASSTAAAPALFSGTGSTAYALVTATDDRTLTISNNGYHVVLGVELAANTGTNVGDTAEILLVANGEAKSLKKVVVAGTFKSGIYEYDSSTIKTAPATFAALTGEPKFRPSQIDVRINDPSSVSQVANKIRGTIGTGVRVMDWQEANQPLFAALRLEQRAATTVIVLILLVAVLNITTTLSMIVAERRHDIAVLRSYGAQIRTIVLMFIAEGLAVGLIGTGLGSAVGWLFCAAANWLGLFRLDPQVYSIGNIPLNPEASDVLLIIAGALALCAAASIYPAYRAGRVKPLDLLRNV